MQLRHPLQHNLYSLDYVAVYSFIAKKSANLIQLIRPLSVVIYAIVYAHIYAFLRYKPSTNQTPHQPPDPPDNAVYWKSLYPLLGHGMGEESVVSAEINYCPFTCRNINLCCCDDFLNPSAGNGFVRFRLEFLQKLGEAQDTHWVFTVTHRDNQTMPVCVVLLCLGWI